MIEIQLFGWLLVTLPTAVSVVLLIVSLSSVTYLAMTLIPALRSGAEEHRLARLLGMASALGAFAAAIAGLRVGVLGAGGELIPTLAVSVAAAAACGASTAFVALGAAA